MSHPQSHEFDENDVQVWTVSHWPEAAGNVPVANGPAPVLVSLDEEGVLCATNAGGEVDPVSTYPGYAVWARVL